MAIVDIYNNLSDNVIESRIDTSKDSFTFARVGEFISGLGAAIVGNVKDGVSGTIKHRVSGYITQSDAQSLQHTTVTIPANFAGLEAVDVPTRVADQYFEIVDVDEEQDTVTITARHIWYQNIQNNTLWKPEEDT